MTACKAEFTQGATPLPGGSSTTLEVGGRIEVHQNPGRKPVATVSEFARKHPACQIFDLQTGHACTGSRGVARRAKRW